jgi:hypothetical protein
MFNLLQCNLVLFLDGIIDSLSFHRTIPLLVACKGARNVTFKIIASNTILLLGSLMIYYKGIIPTIDFMSTKVLDNNDPLISPATNNLLSHIIYLTYHILWVIPIYIICYTSSTAWYQELADHVYKHVNGVPKVKGLKDAATEGTYATIAWLMIFIQVQLFNNLTPVITSYLKSLLTYIFANTTADHIILHSTHLSSHTIIDISNYLGQFIGIFLSCALYGWYGFDPYWIATGINPDERFAIMETHWAYFVGFGLPYVLLGRCTTFFVGYGIFLALFPFCIMLGCILDYNHPYKKLSNETIKPLAIYKPAKLWTLYALYWLGSKNKVVTPKEKTQ